MTSPAISSPEIETLQTISNNLASIELGDITVTGDLNESIIVGNYNVICKVNNSNGAIVNVYNTAPVIHQRQVASPPPRAPREFIGRTAELKALEDLILAKRAISVRGPQGIGKTTLAKQVAHSKAAGTLKDGIIYIEGVEDGATLGIQDIFQRLFDALFESSPHSKFPSSAAKGYLSRTSPLVILDHLAFPPNLLDNFGDYLPLGALLIIDGPENDAFTYLDVHPMIPEDAVRLFVSKTGFVWGEDNPQDKSEDLQNIGDLCKWLGYIPQAIVLTALYFREKAEDPDWGNNYLKFFQEHIDENPEVAFILNFDKIYRDLTPDERKMLALTAAAPGLSVDRAWLESAAGGEETSRSLESKRLLTANSPRLRVSDTVRLLLLQRYSSDIADAHTLMMEQMLPHILSELQTRTWDFDYVRDELGNILGLLRLSFNPERWQDVIALGRALDPYLTVKGLWDAWESVLNSVLFAAKKRKDRSTQAWALHQLGTRAIGLGNLGVAVKMLMAALRIRMSLGETEAARYTLHNLKLILPGPIPDPPPPPPPPPDPPWVIAGEYLAANPWIILGVILAAIITAVLAKPALSMSAKADPVTFNPIGQVIQYEYKVNNSGLRRLAGPIAVVGERLPVRCPAVETVGNGDAYLDWNESLECYAQYKITSTDIENGAVTDMARASAQGSELETFPQTVTVSYDPDTVYLSIKSDPQVFSGAGEPITFTYVIENLSDQGLSGPVEVDAGENTQVSCPEGTGEGQGIALASSEALTCTSTYTTTESDVEKGFVMATAQASIGDRRSTESNMTVYAVPSAALGLVKSADPLIYTDIGQPIYYSYIVTNQTGDPLTDVEVVITDHLVKEIFCPDFYKIGNQDGQFDAGEELTCEARYDITETDIDRGFVTNTAVASAGDFTSESRSFTIYYKEIPPILSLAKSADRETYGLIGERVLYTFLVTNTGGGPVEGPILVSDDQIKPDCPPLTEIGDQDNLLEPGESITCTGVYVITERDIDQQTVTNLAWAQGGNTVSEPQTVMIHYDADVQPAFLKLTKYAEPASYQRAGDVISYTYFVTNEGKGPASGTLVVQDDRIDQGVICDVPAGMLEGTIQLNPGETIKCSATYAITQQDMEAGSVTNTAVAEMGDDTSEPASATVYRQSLDLEIQADRQADGYQQLNDVITYSYIVTPYSVTPVSGLVRIQDDKILNISCPDVSPGDPQVVALLAAQPGQPVTCTATYTITQADIDPVEGDRGSVVNNAVAYMDRMESNPASMTVLGPPADPQLEITNSARDEFYDHVDQTITYDYVVKNTGNVTLSPAVQVTDEKGTTVECNAADRVLSPQGTATCTGTYITAQSDFNFGSSAITHTVTAAGSFRQAPVVSGPASSTITCSYPPGDWLPFTVAEGEDFGTITGWFSSTNMAEMQRRNCMGLSEIVSPGQTLYAPEAPPMAVVSGIITDISGSRVAGVTVVLYRNGVFISSQVTGGDGFYRFSVPEPGDYTIFHTKVPLRRDRTTTQNFEILPVPR